MENIGFYDKRQVAELTTWSATTIWRNVRAGKFPAPIKISPGRVAWLREDVHDWFKAKRSGSHHG